MTEDEISDRLWLKRHVGMSAHTLRRIKQDLGNRYRAAKSPVRIRLALARCSRDRWVSPEIVQKLVHSWCRRVCGSEWVMSATVYDHMHVYSAAAQGLLRGQTPFLTGSKQHVQWITVLEKHGHKKLFFPELEILKIINKELK